MEENKFFKWTGRVNSIFFLVLLILLIGFVIYGFTENNRWRERNTVEVTDDVNSGEEIQELRLGSITKVCGTDTQYVKLNSAVESKGFSSGGYGSLTRNVVFFVGENMDSHWLFNTNAFLINEIDQLKKKADNCKDKETVSIYYEIRKEDTNKNGELDDKDLLTVALTTADGLNYTEIESGITSVLDYSVNESASVLILLVQYNNRLLLKKYSLKTSERISEKEITRIGKKL